MGYSLTCPINSKLWPPFLNDTNQDCFRHRNNTLLTHFYIHQRRLSWTEPGRCCINITDRDLYTRSTTRWSLWIHWTESPSSGIKLTSMILTAFSRVKAMSNISSTPRVCTVLDLIVVYFPSPSHVSFDHHKSLIYCVNTCWCRKYFEGQLLGIFAGIKNPINQGVRYSNYLNKLLFWFDTSAVVRCL